MPRKRKRERKEAMALRLADDSGRTLEECTRMTKEQIIDNLRDLGLTGRMQVELSTEEYNDGQSWVERKEKAAEKAVEKAEKAAAKAEKAAENAAAKAEKAAAKAEKAAAAAAGLCSSMPKAKLCQSSKETLADMIGQTRN